MIHPTIPTALLALAAPVAAAQDIAKNIEGIEVAQLSLRERIVIRIPRMAPRTISPPIPTGRAPIVMPPVEWREKKGPECLPMTALAGAIVRGRDSIDFVMAGGKRMRAKLDGDCKPIDFYSDFYIRPMPDGQVCADRDSIRSRSGATCPIEKFKRLEAKR